MYRRCTDKMIVLASSFSTVLKILPINRGKCVRLLLLIDDLITVYICYTIIMSGYNAKIIKEERIDNPDGSYITKEIYEDNTSCIRYWDKKKNNLKCEFYNDDHFKNLKMTAENRFKKDGSYISKNKYVEPTLEGFQSIIVKYAGYEIIKQSITYSDDNFKIPIEKRTHLYYPDNKKSKDILIEHMQENYSELEEHYNNGEIVRTKKCKYTGLLAFLTLYPYMRTNILLPIVVGIGLIPVYQNHMPSFFVIGHTAFFIFCMIVMILQFKELYWYYK